MQAQYAYVGVGAGGGPGGRPERSRMAAQSYMGKVNAPEFPAGLDWINTDRPLSLKKLRGKLVILDFWTYC